MTDSRETASVPARHGHHPREEHAKAIEEESLKLLLANSEESRQLMSEGMKHLDPALSALVAWPNEVAELVNHVDPPSIELGAEPGVMVLCFLTSWEEEHGVRLTVFAEPIPRLEIVSHWDHP